MLDQTNVLDEGGIVTIRALACGQHPVFFLKLKQSYLTEKRPSTRRVSLFFLSKEKQKNAS